MGRSNAPLHWTDGTLDTLIELSAKQFVEHPGSICDKYVDGGCWVLKPGISLPQEICERIIETRQDIGPEELNDEFMGIFSDTHATRVKRAFLRYGTISDEGLCSLLKHNLEELDILNCKKLTEKSIEYINIYGSELLSLSISNSSKVMFPRRSLLLNKLKGSIIKTPKLKKLILNSLIVPERLRRDDEDFYELLLKPFEHLLYLDLSHCRYLRDLPVLSSLKNLTSLILHDLTASYEELFPTICTVKSLRCLDISQDSTSEEYGRFKYPDKILRTLVESLPDLTHLDISGTNLAGKGTFQSENMRNNTDVVMCDIPGLQSRVNSPLVFLGLYDSHHNASYRFCIPAKIIAGDANEEQVLAAAEAYIDRPNMLTKALNEIFHIFRFGSFANKKKALELILNSMARHKSDKQVQISGSASLFYITKTEKFSAYSKPFAKLKMTRVLLDAMERYPDDMTLMRNSCLTFCQYRMPDDLVDTLWGYRRLVNILIKVVGVQQPTDVFVRRIAIFILNTLACQVDGHHKTLVGDLGVIETMLSLISSRLQNNNHDEVMDIAWSTMWNVTDETAVNCQRFLEGKGLEYFLRCMKQFPTKEELLRNMMGLLGNVAEVAYLRSHLMTSTLISTFTRLLHSDADGIEVSYNAAGVLSHIMSDGPEVWTIDVPSRAEVLSNLVEAINRWDIKSSRNINYRSFEPILRLLNIKHTPECQHWATWALANLTGRYPYKYCLLLEEENGIVMLQDVINTCPSDDVVKLACIVIATLKERKTNPTFLINFL